MYIIKDRGPYMQTFTGRKFYPLDPRAEDIDIVDIAHGLSNICRFGGHTIQFYSVAQHSFLVALECPLEHGLWGLLHDGTEAFLGDMVKPLKKVMPEFQQVEKNLEIIIAQRFGLKLPIPAAVKLADNILCATEARDLMGYPDWAKHGPIPLLDRTIRPWSAAEARETFIGYYHLLKGCADANARNAE